jgi:hypothetical protein
MREFKHTPGPWVLRHISDSNFAVQRFEIRSGSSMPHPIFNKDTSTIDGASVFMSPEDAKLVHAAPDLLKAAEEVCEAWGKFIDSFNYVPGIGDTVEDIEFQEMMRLRAAINKAIE